MQHITDDMIDACVQPEQAQHVLREAFLQFGQGRAAVQARERTEAQGVKLSTLGAVLPDQGIAGAKVYTTIAGRFGFVVLLFSARDGRPLASLDAAALTRIRTAACSVLAARALARPQPQTLGLFGLGVQGIEHAWQLTRAFPITRLLVHDPHVPEGPRDARLAQRLGVPVVRSAPDDIAAASDLIVTATRSRTALFSGDALCDHAFVAAIGSSLPDTRELDDAALRRAGRIVVEWKAQTLQEAGDLILAGPDTGVPQKLVELSDILAPNVRSPNDPAPNAPVPNDSVPSIPVPDAAAGACGISIYKGVGIGLADIALAGFAWRQLADVPAIAAVP